VVASGHRAARDGIDTGALSSVGVNFAAPKQPELDDADAAR